MKKGLCIILLTLVVFPSAYGQQSSLPIQEPLDNDYRRVDESDVRYYELLQKTQRLEEATESREYKLFDSCANGDLEAIKEYLMSGGDPNLALRHSQHHYSLLSSAVIAGQVDVVKLLLEHGADVNQLVGGVATPLALTKDMLRIAEMKNDEERVRHLFEMTELLRSCGGKEQLTNGNSSNP